MIKHHAYSVEPWSIRETELDLGMMAQCESLFALANGHIGLRGNLDEGEPHALPGTYLNSVYELRPLPYAEAGYGYPASAQSVINVTNGKLIRLLVDDEPFDLRYGQLHRHERVLDLRDGVLHRTTQWTSPAGRTVEVRSTRLVSFAYRSIAAISYEVRPVDGPAQVVLQSELVANEPGPQVSDDPRAAAVLEAPLIGEENAAEEAQALLIHRVKRSGLRIGAGMDHVIDGSESELVGTRSYQDSARTTVTCQLAAGESLRIIKFLAYGWSSERSQPAIRAQVEAALIAAKATGWAGLCAAQRQYLDEFWARADVEVDGDPEVQQAVRFGLFHVLQASARAERRPIAAKGLTGPGYDGHAFWDTETFVLPVLAYTNPEASADALRWRHATLPIAQQRARQLHLNGAAFAWRTITGEECSAYWPAGTAAYHINADIADAVIRQIDVTGDADLDREIGVDLLVNTARLWMSLGAFGDDDRFHIDGVTGPDEYSAIADNNVYTNLMAQRNLRGAVDAVARHPDLARNLEVSGEEVLDWRRAADQMVIPYDERRGVHPQAERFTDHARWDFEHTPPEHYPLMLYYSYGDLYRTQVVKQADLVLALFSRGDAFTPEEKARDFAYYEAVTVRDSSLSACVQSVIAAEIGQLDLAYDYLGEAAMMDLADLEHNTRDGIHVASLAGAWIALVAGLGGMRDHNGRLSFAPRLPTGLRGLSFRVCWRRQTLRVSINHEQACYEVADGMPMNIVHFGQEVTVEPSEPLRLDIPPITPGPRPTQPPGREPLHREPPEIEQ
ncbi:glycoside hydrolase family 65 protein [Rugosimonospora africana]|uniref:Glycosyl hydrolase n=1 Tax=Rugosimonospora africana TaxID=556532 RepID=A0A8J3QUT3_9ACTN|nr:glycoside hydrolase family 65 protein [Rugosimonospora africana]GIH16502.1 glycosyl hydrolase [Rugosimonospora africana]